MQSLPQFISEELRWGAHLDFWESPPTISVSPAEDADSVSSAEDADSATDEASESSEADQDLEELLLFLEMEAIGCAPTTLPKLYGDLEEMVLFLEMDAMGCTMKNLPKLYGEVEAVLLFLEMDSMGCAVSNPPKLYTQLSSWRKERVKQAVAEELELKSARHESGQGQHQILFKVLQNILGFDVMREMQSSGIRHI